MCARVELKWKERNSSCTAPRCRNQKRAKSWKRISETQQERRWEEEEAEGYRTFFFWGGVSRETQQQFKRTGVTISKGENSSPQPLPAKKKG
jgi:hypothetical protein